jgi:hypothetical protein
MNPQDCEGCDECGTTYATHPDGHKPRIEHDWKPQFNRNTGEPDRPYCRRCFTHQREFRGALKAATTESVGVDRPTGPLAK